MMSSAIRHDLAPIDLPPPDIGLLVLALRSDLPIEATACGARLLVKIGMLFFQFTSRPPAARIHFDLSGWASSKGKLRSPRWGRARRKNLYPISRQKRSTIFLPAREDNRAVKFFRGRRIGITAPMPRRMPRRVFTLLAETAAPPFGEEYKTAQTRAKTTEKISLRGSSRTSKQSFWFWGAI